MIEILIAICIFSLMILPILYLTISQNRNAYSVSKHLMANQFCSSIMDDFMSKTYNQLIEQYGNGRTMLSPEKVINHRIVKINMHNIELNNSKAAEQIERDFSSFTYKTKIEVDDNLKIITITANVSYSVFNDNRNKNSIELKALKHGYSFGATH